MQPGNGVLGHPLPKGMHLAVISPCRSHMQAVEALGFGWELVALVREGPNGFREVIGRFREGTGWVPCILTCPLQALTRIRF